jgi:hypothetical protein
MSLQVRLPPPRGGARTTASSALRSCTSCGFATRHRALYDRHVKRCAAATEETHQSDQIGGSSTQPHKVSNQPHLVNRNYRCKQCNFTTTKSKMFLFHQKETHSENINIFPCDICEYASRYKCKVLRHRKFIHPNAKELDANGLQQEDDEILALEAQEDRENMSLIDVQPNGETPLEDMSFHSGSSDDREEEGKMHKRNM